MSTASWITVVVLGWYPTGLLLVGLVMAFEKPDPNNWKRDRKTFYGLASLGPILAILLLVIGASIAVGSATLRIKRIFTQKGVRLVALTDWVIAGFRKPPVLPPNPS